ncbi:MAG TPA: DUF6544 family protein [Anaerolineae bacterium]|nr:DUF6544 family protein [Anaerolineae bacterium]
MVDRTKQVGLHGSWAIGFGIIQFVVPMTKAISVEDMMEIIIGILVTLVILAVIGWLGLAIKPRAIDAYPSQPPDLETIPLPEELPAPVERFYRAVYGDRIPVVESAVMSGRARLRLFGITFPGRFRFIHIAGQDYHHYIEATLFGLPIIKVNEYYVDDKSRMELPLGVVEGEFNIDQAANLGLWAESFVWLPAILITDPRVSWESIDDNTALAQVPFGGAKETFVARFDPQTGMLRFLEAMRYKEATDETKTLWINEAREWRDIMGHTVTAIETTSWFDEGTPWAVWALEEVIYSADVRRHIRAAGP